MNKINIKKIEENNKKGIRIRKLILKDTSIYYQIYTKNSWYYLCSPNNYLQLSFKLIFVNDITYVNNIDYHFVKNYDLSSVIYALERNEKEYITNPKYIEVNNFYDLKDYIKNYYG